MRHHRFAFSAVLFVAVVCSAQDVIPWQDAAKYYSQNKTVEGTVVATRNTGKVCFLNFSPNWKTDFTAVIFASDFDKFPSQPEELYRGKRVRVTGRIQEYQGKPQIILKGPSQIVIFGGEKPQAEMAPAAASAVSLSSTRYAATTPAQEQTVYVTKTGTKYHRAGCSSLSRSMIPMPLNQAAARYGPCGNCRPPTLTGGTG